MSSCCVIHNEELLSSRLIPLLSIFRPETPGKDLGKKLGLREKRRQCLLLQKRSSRRLATGMGVSQSLVYLAHQQYQQGVLCEAELPTSSKPFGDVTQGPVRVQQGVGPLTRASKGHFPMLKTVESPVT